MLDPTYTTKAKCPTCGCTSLRYEDPYSHGENVFMEVQCKNEKTNCPKWFDVFSFVGVMLDDDKDIVQYLSDKHAEIDS